MTSTCLKKRVAASINLLLLIGVVSIFAGGCKEKGGEEGPGPSTTESAEQTEVGQAQEVAVVEHDRALRILYAGHPGSDREKDFVDFLAKHFDTVETGDLKAFKESDAEGFDVTILDYDGDGFKAPRPRLSQSFARPVITMGVAGAFISGSLDLKTDYL